MSIRTKPKRSGSAPSSISTPSCTPNPPIASPILLYGIIPLIVFVIYSFIDDQTFGILSGVRVENSNNNGNVPVHHQHEIIDPREGSVITNKEYQKSTRDAKTSDSKAEIGDERSRSQPRDKVSEQLLTRQDIDDQIVFLRKEHQRHPNDIYKAVHLANALLERDLNIHDGGSVHEEAIETFWTAIRLARERLSLQDDEDKEKQKRVDINDELMLEIEKRSIRGQLVGAYCNLGRQYYMANIFEKAAEVLEAALELEPDCMDALNTRAMTLIILGKYQEAGDDYSKLLDLDPEHNIIDVFSGIVKVLKAKEDSIPNGWKRVYAILSNLIPNYEQKLSQVFGRADSDDANITRLKAAFVDHLKKMHLVMFAYHDHKSGDTDLAWYHLTSGYRYKMSTLPPYNALLQQNRIQTVQSIFQRGFWPSGVGSSSQMPIFIIGFPRSGSTLLERILDAHPQIVGTGEDSVFNGMLGEIRDGIVRASMGGDPDVIQTVVQGFANKVDRITLERWKRLKSMTYREEPSDKQPLRFVDKMLSNYLNVGFIQMLYPNALILHIVREPMGTIFSAYKHEFPPGNLDYSSEFESLSDMYRGYRDIMDHWERHLPGRITHIRYEDIVHDFPTIAKSVIAVTGLDWDEDVLSYHKKKQAVNTHSTVQVRKGVNKDSLQSWKRYEDKLEPLFESLGPKYTKHKFQTNLQPE